MSRGLIASVIAVAAVAVAVGGVVLWDAAKPSAAPAAPRPPTPSPEIAALQKRLLEDDQLTPPPLDAPREVQRAYDMALRRIQSGNDPLLQAAPPAADAPAVVKFQQRIEERRKASRERASAKREAVRKEREERQKKDKEQREARRARRERAYGPQPPSVPDTKIELGPPVIFDEAPAAPPPSSQ